MAASNLAETNTHEKASLSDAGVVDQEKVNIPHLPTIHDNEEAHYRVEDQIRSDLLVQDLDNHATNEYLTSTQLIGTSIAMGVATVATYWSFVVPITASPYIIADIGATPNSSLTSVVWTMCGSISLILYGRLSDQFGRKPFAVGGPCLSLIGCIVAATAKDFNTLIGANVLLGIAAGPYLGYTLFAEVAPARWKFLFLVPAFCLNSLSNGFGTYFAAALGQTLSWRYTYYLAIMFNGLGASAMYIFYHPPGFRQIHGPHRKISDEIRRLDFVGLGLVVAGAALFILGISFGGQRYPWKTATVIALIVVGGVLLLAFVAWEVFGNARLPLMPPRLFKEIRGFYTLIGVGCVGRIVYTSSNVLWPSEVATIYYAGSTDWKASAWASTTVPFGALSALIVLPFMRWLKHTKFVIIFANVWTVAFYGAQLSLTPTTLAAAKAFSYLSLAPTGVIQDFVLLYAQLVCNPLELGFVVCLMLFLQNLIASVFTAVFVAILSNTLPTELVKKVSTAALDAGLPAADLGGLLAGIPNVTAMAEAPGVTTDILNAAAGAIPYGYSAAYKNVAYAGFACTIVGLIISLFMKSYDEFLTNRVSRPVYKRNNAALVKEIDQAAEEKLGRTQHVENA